jgi:hypothetical protein
MGLLKILFFLFLLVLTLFLIWSAVQNSKMKNDTQYSLFINGKVPAEWPDGFYKGQASFMESTWIGKRLNAKEKNGVNVFMENGQEKQKYVFKNYVGKSLTGTGMDVIKIDYDLPENPWWLRMMVDEIVEDKPGHFTGQLYFRGVPGVPVPLGYFTLEK